MTRKQPDLFGTQAMAVDRFEQDAMGFLLAYAKRMGSKSFSAEEVTLAATKKGIASTDLRHWGQIFNQAARDGAIVRSGETYRRVMGNGTLAVGWRAGVAA